MKPSISRLLQWAALALFAAPAVAAGIDDTRFQVTVSRGVAAEPITGRLIVVVSSRETPEPRFAISLTGPLMLGADLEQLSPGGVATVDASSDSYPLASLRALPAGEYFVQALVIRYHQTTRADGHTV